MNAWARCALPTLQRREPLFPGRHEIARRRRRRVDRARDGAGRHHRAGDADLGEVEGRVGERDAAGGDREDEVAVERRVRPATAPGRNRHGP